MKAPFATCFFLVTLMAGSAHAAISVSDTDLVVTDHRQGATITTFYDSLSNLATGNQPTTTGSNRISLDANDVSGQSFTLASAITLDSIYFGYNEQQSTGTFNLRIDVGNNGTFDHTYTVTLGALGDLDTTTTANLGPFHFLQFDVSAAEIALGAGVHSFSLLGVTDNGEGGYLFATLWAGNDYAGGSQIAGTTGGTGSVDPTRDSIFAITAIPEPSSGLLALFASSAMLLRRRRA